MTMIKRDRPATIAFLLKDAFVLAPPPPLDPALPNLRRDTSAGIVLALTPALAPRPRPP